jgi:hypothetical protein
MAMPKTIIDFNKIPWVYKKLPAAALAVLLLIIGVGVQARAEGLGKSNKSEKTTVQATALLWKDPTNIRVRDLRYGQGGERHSPHTTVFRFVKEDLSGSNPKFIVTDQSGVKWKIKLGAEAKPEVAASRLVWAVGYFTPEDYYLPELQVTGMPAQRKQYVAADGTMRAARLQRMDKSENKSGNWPWKGSAFDGSRELNGLRVLMALINNWDLKDANNKIVEKKIEGSIDRPKQEVYSVSDLGASFGPTGIVLGKSRSRGNLAAYRSSKFVTKVTPSYVDFATPSRATWLEAFNPPKYFMRLHLRSVGRHIPRSDAKWLATILARLSPEQIRDAFRAAGYSPEEVEGYAKIVERRIYVLSDI